MAYYASLLVHVWGLGTTLSGYAGSKGQKLKTRRADSGGEVLEGGTMAAAARHQGILESSKSTAGSETVPGWPLLTLLYYSLFCGDTAKSWP